MREGGGRTIVRVFVQQDDGVAEDEGHARRLKGQILLGIRRMKA